MGQRCKSTKHGKTLHNVAISFYNSKQRDEPNLRKACCDRHVLDDTIDKWKVEQRVDGLQSQIRGISRADIIFSLRVHWKLIDRKLQTENVIIWTADDKVLEKRMDYMNDNDDDEVFVCESISAGERVARAKAQATATNQIIVIDESDDEDFDGGGKLLSNVDNSASDKVDADDTSSTVRSILNAEPHSIEPTAKRNFEVEDEGIEIKRAKFGKDMM